MTSAIKPTQITFKKVESEWYNYHNTLKEIARLREEIMNPYEEEPDDPTIVKGASSVRDTSSPTEKIASRLVTSKQLSYLEEITKSIERVYNALPEDYKKLVRVRYWGKRKISWDEIAAELHVHRSTAIRWRNEIVQATIELLGWR